jgi:ribosomal protein S18 acetylase RimI-like enzyme
MLDVGAGPRVDFLRLLRRFQSNDSSSMFHPPSLIRFAAWVAVAESHQRRGIGTLLVTRMFKLFSEEHITTVIADTPKENYPAIQVRCFTRD